MLNIYEYCDYLGNIRRQINNIEYDLDDIMYKRMKKYIMKEYIQCNRHYMLCNGEYNINYVRYYIDNENINDIHLKNILLYYNSGYKDMFFMKIQNPFNKICDVEMKFTNYMKRYGMEQQIKIKYPQKRCDILSLKQVYKLWIKL